jgi:phenol hydroxylase P3 protein
MSTTATQAQRPAQGAEKMSLKEKYATLTRDLAWETTYQPMDNVFPYD